MSINTMNDQQHISNIETVLKKFNPISLQEMDTVQLMNRFDSKFMTSIEELPSILEEVMNEYRVLSFGGVSMIYYDNVYFDTDELKFFFDHHNERALRQKVRIRKYAESGACYFEVKLKDNKGQTHKKRIPTNDLHLLLSETEKQLLKDQIPSLDGKELKPQLFNHFYRITLVNLERKERATIDTNISFDYENIHKDLPELVIIEIKQEKGTGLSALKQAMRRRKNVGTSISKYCLGNILTHPSIKYNNFKEKIITLKKIEHAPI